jgi:hypothetical protein
MSVSSEERTKASPHHIKVSAIKRTNANLDRIKVFATIRRISNVDLDWIKVFVIGRSNEIHESFFD